jgi:phage-related protein
MEIFRLFGSILLQGGNEAEQQLDNIDKKGESAGNKLAAMGGKALKAGTAIVGGIVGAGVAMLGFANKTSESTSRISDMSQKMGMSMKGFQEWDFILGQNGTSIDNMSMGMKALADKAVEGSDAFKQLGIDVKNADGSMKSQQQLFEETVIALQGIEDTTKRASMANDLLGKSAMELGPLLNAGVESVDELRNKAHELGLVMSDEAVNAGEAFGDSMEQLQKSLGGLLNQALGPMMPMLNDLIQQLITLLPPLMAIIAPLLEKLMPVLGQLLSTLLPPLIEIFQAFMPVLSPLLDLFLLIVDSALMPLIKLLVQILKVVMPPLIEVFAALMPVLEPIFKLLGMLLENVMPLFIKIFEYITTNVLGNFKGILGDLAPVFENVMKAIGHLMDFWLAIFTGDWAKAWDSLKAYFIDIWNIIQGVFKTAANGIIRGINALIRGLNKIKFDIPDWVPIIGGESFGIKISEIPLLAAGGNIQRSGAAIVGDNGPELLDLPKGAKVTPLNMDDETDSSKPNVVINNNFQIEKMEVRDDSDPKRIAEELNDMQQDDLRGIGVVPV